MGNENSRDSGSSGAHRKVATCASPLETDGFDPKHGVLNKEYVCLFFRKPGLICLINGQPVHELVRAAIVRHWDEKQLEPETSTYGAHTFKLAGIPYDNCVGKDDAIVLRQVASQILGDMWAAGWTLVACSEISRKGNLTSWFFRKDCSERPQRKILCLSLSSFDALILIDSDTSSNLHEHIEQTIHQYYKPGLDDMKRNQSNGSSVFVLNELPWDSDGSARRHGMWLLLKIVDEIYSLNYEFYGRVNFKGTVDSLFFIQSEDVDETSIPHISTTYVKRCVMSFEKKDRLRFMGAPAQLIGLVRDTIMRLWVKGIVSDGAKEDRDKLVWEFKLGGSPWCSNDEEEIMAKRMILSSLVGITALGWRIVMTADTSRRKDDTSMVILESCPVPVPMQIVCLSPSDLDQLQLIGADEALTDSTRELIDQFWPFGIEEETRIALPDGITIPNWSFNSRPWGSDAKNGVACRMLMVGLLSAYEELGWTCICSMDLSAKVRCVPGDTDSPPNPDVWFFAKVHPSVKDSNVRIRSISLRDPTPPSSDLLTLARRSYQSNDSPLLEVDENQIGCGGDSSGIGSPPALSGADELAFRLRTRSETTSSSTTGGGAFSSSGISNGDVSKGDDKPPPVPDQPPPLLLDDDDAVESNRRKHRRRHR